MVMLACLSCADIAGRRLISPFTVTEVKVERKSLSLNFVPSQLIQNLSSKRSRILSSEFTCRKELAE